MRMRQLDIVLVGVGGQGTLLASKILGALALQMNYDVKVSEVHGMAQRGGSVVTYLRIGEGVCSPLVETAMADYVIAFEQMEAMRALPYLKAGGTVITNTQKISPMPVVMGTASYPDDLIEKLEAAARVIKLEAMKLAEEAGEARAVNLVLLGALCRDMNSDREAWEKAIASCVPEKLLAVNLKAFELGYDALN